MNINILNQVLILFLIMLTGYFARKKNYINSEINKGLSELLIYITQPFMLVTSFNYKYSKDMLLGAAILFVTSFIIHFSIIFVSRLLYKKGFHDNQKGVLKFVTVFSNCGFMGYPVLQSVYGKLGVFYTAVFNVPITILMWTYGISLFTKDKSQSSFKKVILNPGIFSVFIGLILFVLSIKIPYPLFKALDMVGSTTTPLSMMVVGAMLAEESFLDILKDKGVYIVTAMRLVAVPLAVFTVLKLIGFKGMFLGVPFLVCAMPGAANSVILSQMYGGDARFASKCVFITTIVSIISIPLMILML